MKTILIIFFSFFFILSCEQAKMYEGTLKGYELCLEENKSENVSIAIIEKACAEKQSKFIYEDLENKNSTAIITPNLNNDSFTVRSTVNKLRNASQNIIITGYNIGVYHIDDKGNKTTEWITLSGLWIEPSQYFWYDETLFFDYDLNDENTNTYCGQLEVKENCYGWNLTGYKGISVILN